ncbi:MAG: hypothetical protein FWC51_00605 [Proteobacteria bacterium]|nr:hypothetical protein [Pseudomonadota bacterium]
MAKKFAKNPVQNTPPHPDCAAWGINENQQKGLTTLEDLVYSAYNALNRIHALCHKVKGKQNCAISEISGIESIMTDLRRVMDPFLTIRVLNFSEEGNLLGFTFEIEEQKILKFGSNTGGTVKISQKITEMRALQTKLYQSAFELTVLLDEMPEAAFYKSKLPMVGPSDITTHASNTK